MYFFENIPSIIEKSNPINLFEIMQFIANLATSITVIYLAVQHIRDKKNRATDAELKRREHSVSIAEKYASFISNQLGVVITVYDQLDIFKMIDFINFEEIQYFNTIEMHYLFENRDDLLNKIQKKTKMSEIPLKILVISYLHCDYLGIEERKDLVQLLQYLDMPTKIKNTLKSDKKDKFRILEETYHIILRTRFTKDVEFVMNNLEWIALSANLNVATDQVLYDVVSQTFLKTCKLLYVRICEANGEYSYAYLNIAELYRKWVKKFIIADKEKRELKEKSANNGGVSYNSLNDN